MCFTSLLEEEKVLCEYLRRKKKSVLHEPQIGSGDFGSGDIGSGEFDQFEISQELRLTSTKIPGGIWSIYWSKLLSHRC